MRTWQQILLAGLAVLLCLTYGCSDFSYYMQCASGQLDIIAKRRTVSDVLNDPTTTSQVREQLTLSQQIRDFASSDLGLPDNDSYRYYSDLGRPYVLWNVVATPEFSLDPVTWCFPVAGCVPYRGYYKEEDARNFARKLQEEGHDIWVYGVPAYSTLNWFSDPILNTFSHYPESALAGMIFHELAHQKVYLPGESVFNESFAETIEQIGVERWLAQRGRNDLLTDFENRKVIQGEFSGLAIETRSRLKELFSSKLSPEVMRAGKQEILDQFRRQLEDRRSQDQSFSRYRAWLGPDVNNAWFASMNTYRKLIPAFSNLYSLKQGRLDEFYFEVARIATLDPSQRSQVLDHLTSLEVAKLARPPLAGKTLSQTKP